MSKIDDFIMKKEFAVGTFLFSRSQAAIEVLAGVGFDFVVIGAEHFMVNPETIERLITAAEAADIVPFVRVQENTDLIQRALDCGTEGIISPMINSPDEAREVVNIAKFPPLGKRGVGNPRSTKYGIHGADYMEKCYETQNKNQSVIVQIETVEALDNLDGIASVEGVDSLFVGPWDLSHSLDQTSTASGDNLFEETLDKILEKSSEHEVSVGIFVWDSNDGKKKLDQGFDYVICSGDLIFLANSAEEELKKIEERS